MKKKRYKIDKGQLAFGRPSWVPEPLDDRVYLDSFKGCACFACGLYLESVIPAHIRSGLSGGMGYKPPDYYVLPLCGPCHAIQGRNEIQFWFDRGYTIDEIKIIAKNRRFNWLNSNLYC